MHLQQYTKWPQSPGNLSGGCNYRPVSKRNLKIDANVDIFNVLHVTLPCSHLLNSVWLFFTSSFRRCF